MSYVTVKLPADIGEQIRAIAKRNCRSMAEQVSYWFKKYRDDEETFEEYFERNHLQETIDEVKEGKNCISFSSWEEALDFLNQKKEKLDTEK